MRTLEYRLILHCSLGPFFHFVVYMRRKIVQYDIQAFRPLKPAPKHMEETNYPDATSFLKHGRRVGLFSNPMPQADAWLHADGCRSPAAGRVCVVETTPSRGKVEEKAGQIHPYKLHARPLVGSGRGLRFVFFRRKVRIVWILPCFCDLVRNLSFA